MHCRVETALADHQVVLQHDQALVSARRYQDRPECTADRERDLESDQGTRRRTRWRDPLRPGLQLRLLRLQDARALLPDEDRWKGRRTSSTYVDACSGRDPR